MTGVWRSPPPLCVCGHDEDEHDPVYGCMAVRWPAGYPQPCLCAGYEADR